MRTCKQGKCCASLSWNLFWELYYALDMDFTPGSSIVSSRIPLSSWFIRISIVSPGNTPSPVLLVSGWGSPERSSSTYGWVGKVRSSNTTRIPTKAKMTMAITHRMKHQDILNPLTFLISASCISVPKRETPISWNSTERENNIVRNRC